jgi:HK97 family phage portal protein
MGLIESLLDKAGFISKGKAQTIQAVYGATIGDWESGNVQLKGDLESYQLAVKAVSWVYACVKLIASSGAGVKGYLLNADDKEIEAGEAYDLIKKPNPQEAFFEFIEGTLYDLELCGESYWFKDQLNGKGQPKAIYRLNPRYMKVIPSKTNLIAGFVYEVNGRRLNLTTDEIVFVKYPNPFNAYRGLSPVEAGELTLNTDYYANEYNRNFFKNGARLSGTLETDRSLVAAELTKIRDEFSRLYTGRKGQHKIPILMGGLKYNPHTLTQKDMDFLQLRKFSRDEILALFGVPLPKLGIMEYANYKMEEANKTFWSECMTPKLNRLASKLTEIVQLFDTNQRYEFDTVVKDDEKIQSEILDRYLKDQVFTPNEVREILGYPAVSWGDQPISNTPSGLALPPAEVPASEAAELPKAQATIPAGKGWTPDQKRVFASKAHGERESYVETVKGDLKIFFNDQETRILDRFFKYYDKAKTDIDKVFPEKSEDRKLQRVMTPLYRQIVAAGSATAEGALMVRITQAKLLKGDKLDRIVRQLAKKVTEVNTTTRNAIREAVKQGIEDELHVNDIAYGTDEFKGIVGIFDEASDYRAEMIGRTETATAYSMASVETYKENGIDQKEWITAGDDKVSDECQENQAWGAIGIDDQFPSGDDSPPAHPNCRCAVLPVIE